MGGARSEDSVPTPRGWDTGCVKCWYQKVGTKPTIAGARVALWSVPLAMRSSAVS